MSAKPKIWVVCREYTAGPYPNQETAERYMELFDCPNEHKAVESDVKPVPEVSVYLLVCGDCGDEAREDGDETVHLDGTRLCMGRADAIVRKPELLARYYPGGVKDHPELAMIVARRPDLAALVEAS